MTSLATLVRVWGVRACECAPTLATRTHARTHTCTHADTHALAHTHQGTGGVNDESTDPLDSVTESFTPSSRPNEHTHTHFPKKLAAYNDSTEVEPAYLQPKIIDALGIQPPEQVLIDCPTPYTLHPKIIH